jgi:uncharacterized membrane protein SpoIIM required for sporulation
MREVTFLKQNAETWKGFEKHLNSKQKDPDLLADQFIRITDDLSYAKTFYPESNTTKYLNGVATSVHLKIYKNKKERSSRFLSFWKYEVPMAAYAARKFILYSLIITLVSAAIGLVSEYNNEDFIRILLGDGYVNQTLSNIRNHDPMGIYKSGPPLLSFFEIMFNNIGVAFYAFVSGISVNLITLKLLFQNGIMIGLFECLMFKQGYIWTSLSVLMLHGTLELSSIIIAGGAGLMLGNSILFPGTYTRLQSMMHAAKTGAKIIIGLIPLFIVAAFIEGFISRYSDMALALKLLIIGASFVFVVYYFVIYPVILNKRANGYS